MRTEACALFLAPLALTCASSATQSASPSSAADPARLERDVAWLADDAREGRRAGTAAGLEASRYLAKRFEALGLEAVGTASFTQAFEVPLEPRDGGRSELRAKSASTQSAVVAPDLVPLFCSEGGEASGPVRFVAFAIDDSARGRDDFQGRDLKGAIALVLRGVPKTPPAPPPPSKDAPAPGAPGAAPVAPHDTAAVSKGDNWGGGGLIFTKVMNAKRRGAAGVLLLPAPDAAADQLLAFGEGGSARAGIPCAMLSWKGARTLFGEGVVEAWRTGAETPGGTTPAGFEALATLSADVHREKGPARNVLARLRGQDRDRTLVVGAHYDHLGWGGSGSLHGSGPRAIHNGADDNASGTAAVLEIARILSAGPRPACDVVFALWSGEELGLLGSEYWCQNPTVPLPSVAANLNLDMVGRAGSQNLQVLAAGTAEPFPLLLSEADLKSPLELVVSTAGNIMGGSSDHASFLKRKIPALHLFTGLHADYHKPTDDIERFEAAGAAQVVDLTVDLVRRLAGTPELAFVEPKADPNAKPIQSGFRAWFGSIPNYAYDKGGVLIDGTSPGSPAEHAGFLKGDILRGLGDIPIATIDDFMFALQTYKPGDLVLVKFTRDGVEQETRVTLSTRGQQ